MKYTPSKAVNEISFYAWVFSSWLFYSFNCRTYGALETLTEPHRLLSCLQAVSQLLRTMLTPATSFAPASSASDSRVLRGWHTDGFPSGRAHALKLLIACLPGLDFNDIIKCFVCSEFYFPQQ